MINGTLLAISMNKGDIIAIINCNSPTGSSEPRGNSGGKEGLPSSSIRLQPLRQGEPWAEEAQDKQTQGARPQGAEVHPKGRMSGSPDSRISSCTQKALSPLTWDIWFSFNLQWSLAIQPTCCLLQNFYRTWLPAPHLLRAVLSGYLEMLPPELEVLKFISNKASQLLGCEYFSSQQIYRRDLTTNLSAFGLCWVRKWYLKMKANLMRTAVWRDGKETGPWWHQLLNPPWNFRLLVLWRFRFPSCLKPYSF